MAWSRLSPAPANQPGGLLAVAASLRTDVVALSLAMASGVLLVRFCASAVAALGVATCKESGTRRTIART
jgi:hypothetical protein